MARPIKTSYEEKLLKKHNGKIKLLESYINLNTEVLHECEIHGKYYAKPASILGSVTGCPKCGEERHKEFSKNRQKYTDEEYKELLYKKFNGKIVCLGTYNGQNKSIPHYCTVHNYEWNAPPSSILEALCGCKHCASESVAEKQAISNSEFRKRVEQLTNGKIIPISEYINNNTDIIFEHHCDNGEVHIFKRNPSVFYKSPHCYCQTPPNKLIVGFNDIATVHPEWVDNLENKENATKYTCSSKEKLVWICPDCNLPFKQSPRDVKSHRLACPHCSDGISYPNKFILHSLMQIKDSITYIEKEYKPDWCKFYLNGIRKYGIYDIYFELEKNKYIIEMDGGFHNKIRNKSGLSLEDIKYIDLEKDRLAKEHGVKVIRIDCDYKTNDRYEFIKNNILNSSLSTILDLNKIDFDSSNEKSISSNIVQAAKLWNEGYSIKDIKSKLMVGDTALRTYLQTAKKINLCDYNKEDSRQRSCCTKVICLDTMEIFNSQQEAADKTLSDRGGIGYVCRNNRKSVLSKKYNKHLRWMYYEDYIKEFGEPT